MSDQYKSSAEKIMDRKPWLVEWRDGDLIIYGGYDAMFPIVARVPAPPIGGNPSAEEMALIMAASYDRMFPALALIRRTMRSLCATRKDIPDDVRSLLLGVGYLADAVLPVPTVAKD